MALAVVAGMALGCRQPSGPAQPSSHVPIVASKPIHEGDGDGVTMTGMGTTAVDSTVTGIPPQPGATLGS